MDEQTVKDALKRLTWEEAAVMFHRCQKVSEDDIAAKYPFASGTVWTRLRTGRSKLSGMGIEDDPCEILRAFGEPTSANWPPENWETDEEPPPPPPPVDEEDDTLEEDDETIEQDGVPEPDRSSRLRKLWNGLVAVVTGVLIFFIGYFSGILQSGGSPAEPAAPPAEPTAIVITQLVTQPPPTQLSQPTQEISVTEEPGVDIAVVPTDAVTAISESTNTTEPIPEPTNIPTPSITPTPDPSVREAEGLVMQATNETFVTDFCLLSFELFIPNNSDGQIVLSLTGDNFRFYDDLGNTHTFTRISQNRFPPQCAAGLFRSFELHGLAPGSTERYLVSIYGDVNPAISSYSMEISNIPRIGQAVWEFEVPR